MRNLSLRFKILLIVIPMIIALVASTVLGIVRMKQIEDETTDIYYGTLFEITESVINADRDLYQAMTAHLNLTYREDATPDDKKAYAQDISDNAQQAYDGVHAAEAIAKTDDKLYGEAIGGETFSQLVADFDEGYESVKGILTGGTEIDQAVLENQFDKTRDAIDKMGELVEQWAIEEHDELSNSINTSIVILAVVFSIIALAVLIFGVIIIRAVTKGIREATNGLERIAEGHLEIEIDISNAGNDEVGHIK